MEGELAEISKDEYVFSKCKKRRSSQHLFLLQCQRIISHFSTEKKQPRDKSSRHSSRNGLTLDKQQAFENARYRFNNKKSKEILNELSQKVKEFQFENSRATRVDQLSSKILKSEINKKKKSLLNRVIKLH